MVRQAELTDRISVLVPRHVVRRKLHTRLLVSMLNKNIVGKSAISKLIEVCSRLHSLWMKSYSGSWVLLFFQKYKQMIDGFQQTVRWRLWIFRSKVSRKRRYHFWKMELLSDSWAWKSFFAQTSSIILLFKAKFGYATIYKSPGNDCTILQWFHMIAISGHDFHFHHWKCQFEIISLKKGLCCLFSVQVDQQICEIDI